MSGARGGVQATDGDAETSAAAQSWDNRHMLLGACMRGGAQVYEVTGLGAADESAGMTRLAKSLVHGAESLTYGADWIQQRVPGVDAMAVTCSFYNSEARLWGLPGPAEAHSK
jgi:hypothetical protein